MRNKQLSKFLSLERLPFHDHLSIISNNSHLNLNTLFSSHQICKIKWQNWGTKYIRSWFMRNKHVYLYFFDNCFSSLKPSSVSEFPLWCFGHRVRWWLISSFFLKKTKVVCCVSIFFSIFHMPFYLKHTKLSFN